MTAVATPVIALAVALPAHYPNHFDTLGHLGLIYLATGILVVGALLALPGVRLGCHPQLSDRVLPKADIFVFAPI